MGENFESVGVAEMAPSKRSIRFLFKNPNSVFDEYFYVSIKDLEEVLHGHKKTAPLWKPKE